MQQDHYRETVTETVEKLIGIRGDVFDLLFNLAVTGELKEWADDVPVGDSFTITKDVFEGCTDANMQVLVKLLSKLEDTIDSLCNLNGKELTNGEDDHED